MPPVRGQVILGVDPGFKHGCKYAVISITGILNIFRCCSEWVEVNESLHECVCMCACTCGVCVCVCVCEAETEDYH